MRDQTGYYRTTALPTPPSDAGTSERETWTCTNLRHNLGMSWPCCTINGADESSCGACGADRAAAPAAEGPRDEPVGARDLPSAADSLFLIASKALHRQTPKYLTLRAAALAVVEDNRSRCEVLRMEPSPLMRALAAALVDEELTDALDDLAAANAEVSDAK